jgi:hypothetical protein
MKLSRFRFKHAWKLVAFCIVFPMVFPGFCPAFEVTEDVERPKPEFKKAAEQISAKLIPRGKSSSIEINFQAKGGQVVNVSAYDWDKADRPEVDVKNFRSSLFEIQIDDLTGGEATLVVSCNYFTSATEFFIFNPNLKSPWIKDAAVENNLKEKKMRELSFKIKDGGPLDADGAVNGRITLIGGPRDSFWGYALGTLMLRFWGVFLVLSVLQVGMQLSGLYFRSVDRRKLMAASKITIPSTVVETTPDQGPSPETALAIATALDLYFSAQRAVPSVYLLGSETNAWSQQGRERMMSVRNFTYRSSKH